MVRTRNIWQQGLAISPTTSKKKHHQKRARISTFKYRYTECEPVSADKCQKVVRVWQLLVGWARADQGSPGPPGRGAPGDPHLLFHHRTSPATSPNTFHNLCFSLSFRMQLRRT